MIKKTEPIEDDEAVCISGGIAPTYHNSDLTLKRGIVKSQFFNGKLLIAEDFQ